MVAGGLLALVHAFFSIHLRADQIVSGTAINILALGVTAYAFRSIYGDEGTPRRRPHPRPSTIPLTRGRPYIGDVIGDHERDDLAGADPRRRDLVLPLPHARGACACAPSASTRAPPTPSASASTACATWRSSSSGVLAGLGGAYLVVRAARLVQREHDRRPRLHRPRRAHLRQVASVRRCSARRSCSASPQALGDSAADERRRLGLRRLDAAVRADADRAGRPGRPLVPPAAVGRPYQKQ